METIMPVIVLYKEKEIPTKVTTEIATSLAALTNEMLKAKIEVRVLEPVDSYNANEVHLEMRFRDFGEWSDDQLSTYHKAAMDLIGRVLASAGIRCSYSLYILPSDPKRSIWDQAKTGVK